ncbi:MAG: permease [Actinomycetota bacterium]|nr:permease [Actinomycetota bacterium]
MTQVESASTITPPATRRVGILGVVIVMALLVIGLAWAKWLPYSDKIAGLADTRSWPDGPIFGAAGDPGSIPTISGAWHFWTTYVSSVWKAALVALVVAAAIEALVPKQWLTRLLDRRHTVNQGALGGLLSLPSMMCTCCTAPVAVSLRRNGAPLAASLAYWVGNPLLNPAVIVFLALTLPWEYAAVRVAIGALVVVGDPPS